MHTLVHSGFKMVKKILLKTKEQLYRLKNNHQQIIAGWILHFQQCLTLLVMQIFDKNVCIEIFMSINNWKCFNKLGMGEEQLKSIR